MTSYILDLDNLVKKNCVEIYFTNKSVSLDDVKYDIDVNSSQSSKKPKIASLPFYGKYNTKIIEYYYKDMIYTYDLSNDAQKVFRKTVLQDYTSPRNNKMYCVSYNEETLPIHRFPSTNEIINKEEITRTTYRINNRIFVYHDKYESKNIEYIYIKYNHSENIDIKKMQEDIEKTIKIILKYI